MVNDKVKALIRAMSPAQFADIRAYVKMLGSSPGQVGGKDIVVAETKADDFALHVLDAIVSHMDAKQADFTPRAALIRAPEFKPFVEAFSSGKLAAFFEKAERNKVERRALAALAVALLYEDIMSWSREAVTSRSLMRLINRVPAVVNKAFPGYAASGMLHMVIRQAKEK